MQLSEKDRVSFPLPSPCPGYQAVARTGPVQVAIITLQYNAVTVCALRLMEMLRYGATGGGSRILRDVDIAGRAGK